MISLLGPTAAGKSALAIELAHRINAEVISADSMQVYCGMDIGTAKLTPEERQGVIHHLIDIRNPDQAWTVSDFVEEVHKLNQDIARRGKKALLVGGTGLYQWALLEGFSFPMAAADKELRKRLEKEPMPELYAQLKKVDPVAAEKIHPNDKKRIVRALEVYELTGEPISRIQENRTPNSDFVPRDVSPREHRTQGRKLIGLSMERDQLYSRIDARVDDMINKGLIEEVKGLLAKGYSRDLASFQALGYKEVVEYLDGKWSKEEMVKELKKRTRHFARRQITWFKRFKHVKWFALPIDIRAILDYINS